MEKEDIILFPHRIAPEKQPVFDYIAEQMPEYKFIKCQELNLSKRRIPQIAWESKDGV